MSQVTVSQAATLTGKSRETINKATQQGTLSFGQNASGHKVIDVAELERVYPLVTSMEALDQAPPDVSGSRGASAPDVNAEIAALRERVASSERTAELLTAERERERRQLQDEIENLRASLQRTQDQHSKALLLITDQSPRGGEGAAELQESLRALEARLADHEARTERERDELKRRAARRIKQLQQELEQQRGKSLLERLFG